MNNSFIKVAAGIPKVTLADTFANTENIKKLISSADEKKVHILALPELCVTGYTCGDLFFNNLLIEASQKALFEISEFTRGKFPTVIIGLPIKHNRKLYNCAAVLKGGKILQIIPKSQNFKDRYFNPSPKGSVICLPNGEKIPVNTKPVHCKTDFTEFNLSVIVGDDVLGGNYPDKNADVTVNIAAINQIAGRTEQCKNAVKKASLLSDSYILASSGIGESTTDTVYAGLGFIAQNGEILAENKPFCDDVIIACDIDIAANKPSDITACDTNNKKTEKNPFLPSDVCKNEYLEEILQIQSHALARRIEHTHSKRAVIGISGGLDSTLAVLVCVRAMKILNRPTTDILSITMPCFGTTKRTRSNSEILCSLLGTDFKEINITDSIKQHFKDIGHSEDCFDVTYENSQARERTQVLMDVANKESGIVIGTGDLSELALGWATYNGDHMSMYAINAGVPKTLVRSIVNYESELFGGEVRQVLLDILNTPVSPELLPADSDGKIAQKTENLVGPYELHDFFLYHMLALNESPKEILHSAKTAFSEYDDKTIHKWLTVFIRRFFAQQFKRSCLPDGPKVFSISVSPRCDLKMPSDAYASLWLEELEKIKP